VKLAYVKGFDPWNIIIGTGVFIDDLWTAILAQLWILLGVTAALALPAIGLLALVGQNISAVLRRLAGKMRALADGDLSVTFPEAARGDELGAMGKAQVFKHNAAAKARLEAEQADLAHRAEADKRKAMAELADSFGRTVGGMIGMVALQRQLVWWFYADLKLYKDGPTAIRRTALRRRFDRIFTRVTGFAELDEAVARTHANKNELLLVLDRPDILLHTNGSENDVRSFVTKRRISGETRSAAGKQARDTFLSLLKTCSKLAISFWDYLGARLKIPDADRVPWLPDLIRQNASA
jgi:hypothetical protein